MPNAMNDELVIEPGRTFRNEWTDLWRYRELFYILAWRDVAVRYKQTVIGVAWAVIRPFVTMVIFTIVFNKVAKLEAPGSVPYALLVFAAMLPWQFFSMVLSESSASVIGNANLISKVYFPRLIIPAASAITSRSVMSFFRIIEKSAIWKTSSGMLSMTVYNAPRLLRS
jgi:homopolymeric O-antigen transport system permease protein